MRAEWQVGVYVRAHGHINSFNRERMMVAFNIRRITDLNEVTYHGLQVVFQHLHLTKGLPAAGQAGPTGGAAAPPAVAPNVDATGLTPVQADVLGLLVSLGTTKTEAGVSVTDVLAASGGRYAPQQLRATIEELQDQGRCYSTTDDEHFRAVE